MKLIARIKAESSPPSPSLEESGEFTVGNVSVTFPPSPVPITATHPVPQAFGLGSASPFKKSVIDAMAQKLAQKLDQDFCHGVSAKKEPSLLQESPVKASYNTAMHFPGPAKDGTIMGVWGARLETVEYDQYSTKYRVCLRVLTGPEKGSVIVLTPGDDVNVQYKVHLGGW